jgi:hypothetical protein
VSAGVSADHPTPRLYPRQSAHNRLYALMPYQCLSNVWYSGPAPSRLTLQPPRRPALRRGSSMNSPVAIQPRGSSHPLEKTSVARRVVGFSTLPSLQPSAVVSSSATLIYLHRRLPFCSTFSFAFMLFTETFPQKRVPLFCSSCTQRSVFIVQDRLLFDSFIFGPRP